jgi:hypothetical protein
MDEKLDIPTPSPPTDAPVESPPKVKAYAVDKVVNFRNIVIFSTALTVFFQTSYLYSISPVLLSYMSLTDMALKTGIMLPFTTVSLFLVVDFMEDFEDRLDADSGFEGSLAHDIYRWFAYIIVALVTSLAAFILYKTFVMEDPLSEYLGLVQYALMALGAVVVGRMFVDFLWRLSIIRYVAETIGKIGSRNLTTVLLVGTVGASMLGMVGGLLKKGTACEVKVGDVVHEARFLISLESVTVFKISDQTIIMNSTKIEQMNCTSRPLAKDESKVPDTPP